MFSSNFHSFTNQRGYKASTTMPKAMCFAGICRIDWSKKGNNQNAFKHFNLISDNNSYSLKHPLPDNC